VIKPYRNWNFSPDCSGYAIVPRGHFEALAIAFERKAGSCFIDHPKFSLQKIVVFFFLKIYNLYFFVMLFFGFAFNPLNVLGSFFWCIMVGRQMRLFCLLIMWYTYLKP